MFFNQLSSILSRSCKEVLYVTIGNPAFCLALYLIGVHFRGELQHFGQVGGQKIKCPLIGTREIGSVRLQEELYLNKEVFYSVEDLWKVKPKYQCQPILHLWLFQFFTTMLKHLVILFIVNAG